MHPHTPIVLAIANDVDRQAVYAIRHDVYAKELGQHAENAAGQLRDALDDVNAYVVARDGSTVLGFVAITPPNATGYSIDKYFDRSSTGLRYDLGLYEIRLLTVVEPYRHTALATLLMYAALRYVEAHGATMIVAIGRLELLGLYERVGLRRRGLQARSGAVQYELMSADVAAIPRPHWDRFVRRMERAVEWHVPGVSYRVPPCFHGGAFWERLGPGFETLERRQTVISADVLDAWFDPAPAVTERLSALLPFALRTSPPTHAEGIRRAIAAARGLPDACVLPGAGSSDLIFAALRHWVTPTMRVLILDPMYGEYAHLLERVIGATVCRMSLERGRHYDVDPATLAEELQRGYDWVVLVNPNSPTGRHVDRDRLVSALSMAHPQTRIWIDETYVDYVDSQQSLERYASSSTRVVVCKSMSKAYALSGVRAAYLVGPQALIEDLRPLCPPWGVGLPAQIAMSEALRATPYYEAKWRETHVLREELRQGLERLGWEVIPGCANFLLCHLPVTGPTAASLVETARTQDLFLRLAGPMGRGLGDRAIRIAVKDRATNARVLATLQSILAG